MRANQIKVLLVAPIPPPAGGIATWTYKYLEYCRDNNLPVRHVNTSLIGHRAKTVNDSVYWADEIKRCFIIWRDIVTSIKEYVPNVAHLNTNCSPRGLLRDYISARILKHKNIPIILHCRCNVEDQLGTSKTGIFLFRILTKLSARVIAQNEKTRNYVKKLTDANVLIMPNYIESSYICASKSIRQEISQVIFVGHIRNSKGIRELLETAQRTPDIKYVLAGPITNDFTADQIIKNSAGNIIIKGALPTDKIKELLDDADVFVFPTYTEGFSNALLEAMARGVPVITTDVGANHDMIEEFGGRVIETKSSSAIDNALNSIRAYDIRLKMSKWNIEKVKRNYCIEQVMNSLRTLYMEVYMDEHD